MAGSGENLRCRYDPDLARRSLDRLGGELSEGGKVLIERGEHPFSQHYGWVQDRCGASWQIVPRDMVELMAHPGDLEKILEMEKLVIADF